MAKKPRIKRFWWVWKGKAVRGAWAVTAPVPKDADGPFDTKAEAEEHLKKLGPAPELPGNHDARKIGPVTLMCMDRDARDLMDRALAGYKAHASSARKMMPRYRPSVYSFAYWLFRWSGLVDASGKAIPQRKGGAQ